MSTWRRSDLAGSRGPLDARLDERVSDLLRDAEAAQRTGDPRVMHALCNAVLALDPENSTAKALLTGFAVRRQMTLLFCDIVGSTEIADSHDPEVFTALLKLYRSICADVIREFDGWVSDQRGDGMMVLFGYPEVRESDARRGVLCGLKILEELRRCLPSSAMDPDIDLRVRVSVHTDLVVVDDIGVAGPTSNEAARLQDVAATNSVIISDTTYALVKPYFQVECIGPVRLRGVSRLVEAFTVLGEVAPERSMPESVESSAFVGRRSELQLIKVLWEETRRGRTSTSLGTPAAHPTTLLITGPPGMGKTRLVSEAARELGIPNVQCACAQLHENVSVHAFRPLLEEACGITPTDAPQRRLDKLRARLFRETELTGDVPFLATALDIPLVLLEPDVEVDASVRRRQGLNAATALVLAAIPAEPAMLFVDDLHWADQSTLDLIEVLLRTSSPQLLVVLAARDTFVPPWADSTIRRLALEPLSASSIAKLAQLLPEAAALSPRQREELIHRSDGVPLFLEELMRTAGIMESGNIPHRSVRFSHYKIPPALRDPLLARLSLPQVDLELAQAAATIGRDFDEALLGRLIGGDLAAFNSRLSTLFEAGLLEHSNNRIRFRHELIREIAYETQPHATLVARHSCIADQLLSPTTEASLRSAAELAFHLEHALRYEEAIQAHLTVAQSDQSVGSHVQATRRLTEVLALLEKLPHGPDRRQAELTTRQLRSFSAVMADGYSASEAAEDYPRCVELCQQSRAASDVAASLIRTWSYYAFRGDLDDADKVLSVTADTVAAAGLSFPAAEMGQGVVDFFRGRYEDAGAQLTQFAARTSVASKGRPPEIWPLPNDPLAAVEAHLAALLWITGKADQSALWAGRAMERSSGLDFPYGPFSRCYVTCLRAVICNLAGEHRASAGLGAEVNELAERHGFAMWQLAGAVHQLIGLVHSGEDTLLPQLIAYVELWRTRLAAEVWTPYWLTEIARAQARLGDRQIALATLDEALAVTARTGSAFYAAETLRDRATLRLSLGRSDALGDLEAAAELAARQGATVFLTRANRARAGFVLS